MPETNTNTNAQATTQTQTPNYDEIFGKLDAILDKRSEGLARSALKDNGIGADEIADIVKAYREQKQSKAAEQSTALSTAQSRVAELEKQIADRAVDDALSAAALEAGIDPKQLSYVSKLADKDILGDDGKPDGEKAKAAINKLLEDIPAFKPQTGASKGFVPVGNKNGGESESDEDSEKKLRAWFGLK